MYCGVISLMSEQSGNVFLVRLTGVDIDTLQNGFKGSTHEYYTNIRLVFFCDVM